MRQNLTTRRPNSPRLMSSGKIQNHSVTTFGPSHMRPTTPKMLVELRPLLIVLAVFQVSVAAKFILKVSNAKQAQPSGSGGGGGFQQNNVAYKLIALSAEYLSDFLNPFGDEDDESQPSGDNPWSDQDSFVADEDVSFYLYTKSAPDRRKTLRLNDAKSLRSSRFNASHPTRILIHGWLGSEFAGIFSSVTPAYLRKGNYNVIQVDWGRGAIADYSSASQRVKSVGVTLAKFVDFLHQEAGAVFESIYLIGFSMGAHIAGIAGKHVQNGRIPVIFGLDPALPMFSFENTDGRLTSNDASYVEVIHTNAGGYGYELPLGHADFYVNYGNDQPGCILNECSHLRAFKVFSESIRSKLGFWGKGCDSEKVFELLTNKKCRSPTAVTALLGGDSPPKHLRGVYYLKTNLNSPYARGPV